MKEKKRGEGALRKIVERERERVAHHQDGSRCLQLSLHITTRSTRQEKGVNFDNARVDTKWSSDKKEEHTPEDTTTKVDRDHLFFRYRLPYMKKVKFKKRTSKQRNVIHNMLLLLIHIHLCLCSVGMRHLS